MLLRPAGRPDEQTQSAHDVPHERLGEDVAGAVVLKPDAAARPADLREFLGSRLAWSKIPRRFVFVAELPRGTNGKVLQRALREAIGRKCA